MHEHIEVKRQLLRVSSLFHCGFLESNLGFIASSFIYISLFSKFLSKYFNVSFLHYSLSFSSEKGNRLLYYTALGHQVVVGLTVSSPTKAQPGILTREKGSKCRQESQRQALL